MVSLGKGLHLPAEWAQTHRPVDSSAAEDGCAISLEADGTFIPLQLGAGARASRFQL